MFLLFTYDFVVSYNDDSIQNFITKRKIKKVTNKNQILNLTWADLKSFSKSVLTHYWSFLCNQIYHKSTDL
jgi:hypothetical protein